jgi:hypothetical protein
MSTTTATTSNLHVLRALRDTYVEEAAQLEIDRDLRHRSDRCRINYEAQLRRTQHFHDALTSAAARAGLTLKLDTYPQA